MYWNYFNWRRWLPFCMVVITAVFLLSLIHQADAATLILAYTSFEEPELGFWYQDKDDPSTDHDLSNNSGQSRVNYDGGAELGFSARYINSRNSSGLADGDLVGVTPWAFFYPDGQQGYQLSDTDGEVVVTLDTVDLSVVNEAQLTVDYFLQSTSWETNDHVRIWVVVDDDATLELLNTTGQDIDSLKIEGGWRTLTQDLSGYSSATLKFALDSNSGLETLHVDNIVFSGEVTTTPQLSATQAVSAEPLLGGMVQFDLTLQNLADLSVVNKGYNLTVSDTLPVGLSYQSASPTPTFVESQPDGTTLILWDNIADLDAQETLSLRVTAVLSDSLTPADGFTNLLEAAFNDVPDNSGSWYTDSNSLAASPQAIDIEMSPTQSTADEQASGAGEHDSNADWPYSYTITVQNNNVGSTDDVQITAVLPAGVAYLGNPQINPNPNASSTTPTLNLLEDGSLEMSWDLGTLTPAEYASPLEITFETAVSYRFRAAADTAAEAGPFAGPMSGSNIYEDVELPVSYEATGQYGLSPTADGTAVTPEDDNPATIVADYFTVSQSATPKNVGIGTTVNYSINTYVSEYYDVSQALVVDVLPDGMTYMNGSASLTPDSVVKDSPSKGETTISWTIPNNETSAGSQYAITFEATVDARYEAPPYENEPVVSGDNLTNKATIYGDWIDVIENGRSGTLVPDTSRAAVNTDMPTFSKQVQHPITTAWGQNAPGFVGDTLTFHLRYDAAANVDATDIIIRDFLPRGMAFVPNSDSTTTSGSFSSSDSCSSAPNSPLVGTLNGLQYLEWRLCNTAQGSSWETTIDALVGPTPNVQPGWIVANFGKLSGQSTAGSAYSLRDLATIDYDAPQLLLSKTASPSSQLVANDVVTYTITVENIGDATAYNLSLTDIVPADLLIANSGGSAAPTSSSYTTQVGDPASGSGGTIVWSTIASLEIGQSQTFSYSATVPSGLIAGQSMANLASVAYNSRPDNSGHAVNISSDIEDAHTDDTIVYLRGLTVEKSASVSHATIGDTVTWDIVGTVPDGVTGFWPVIEENNLPNGFDYVAGSTTLQSGNAGVQFDPTHGNTPLDNGDRDLRWFLMPITNTTGSPITFTLSFDTFVTGVRGNNISNINYPNNGRKYNADNDAYIGWYDSYAGYDNSNSAYDAGMSINFIDRRSPEADADVKIVQPDLTLDKTADFTYLEAGGVLLFTLQVQNSGKSPAYDILLEDLLPSSLTFNSTVAVDVSSNDGEVVTDNNVNGSHNLSYALDELPQGETWTIRYSVDVDPALTAGLEVQNVAEIISYSSQARTPADGNGDTLIDERVYSGPTDSVTLLAPIADLFKAQMVDDELTIGSTIAYTLTVPESPLAAIMHNVQITDVVDSRLEVVSVSNGTADGNRVTAVFPTIGINQQEQIIITAIVPESTTAGDGDLISNLGELSYDNDETNQSNFVVEPFVMPALVVTLNTETFTVAENDLVTYTGTVQNVGQGRAENLALTLNLPANMSFAAGSATLNGQPLADPTGVVWDLPTHPLAFGEMHTIVFQARVNQTTSGGTYPAMLNVGATNSERVAVIADSSSTIPADVDADDADDVTVYSQLACTTAVHSVAFEDLKNTGWSDWDYNDLIVQIDSAQCLNSENNVGIIMVDYLALARGAGFTHSFWQDLPLNGNGRYQLVVRDETSQIVTQRSGSFAEAPDFEIFANTKQIFAETAAGCAGDFNCLSYVNTLNSDSAYRNGYRATLIVLVNHAGLNPSTAMASAPWDPYINVFDTGEEVHLVVPGHLDNTQTVGTTYDPTTSLLGYDLPLVQAFDEAWEWPVEFIGIWRGYPQLADYISTGGGVSTDWFAAANMESDFLWKHAPFATFFDFVAPRFAGKEVGSRYFAAPVTADLDGDGSLEIILGNQLANRIEVYDMLGRLQWTKGVNGGVKAAVSVADLFPTVSGLEILVPSEDGKLYAFYADGTAVSGWPVRVGGTDERPFRVLATPAVADLDDDNSLEVIVAGSNGRLYVFNRDGSARWNRSLGDVQDAFNSQILNSSPVVADLDEDGMPEIIVGSYDGAVYAFTATGEQLWRYETDDVVISTPAVGDVDPAVEGQETVIGSGDGYVYLLDEAGDLLWRNATGWSVRASAILVNMDNDAALEIVIGSDDDKVWAWQPNGNLVSGWPKSTGGDVFATPAVGDVDGDGKDEIIAGSDDGMLYAWEMNGTAVLDWPVSAGTSIKGQPAIANLDDDPDLEVVYATIDGEQEIVGGGMVTVYLPMLVRQP